MPELVWDKVGERYYNVGVSKGVLYPYGTAEKPYGTGVAWSGLSNVTRSPSGAEATAVYADNIKYLNITSTEEFAYTIEAYTYPDEWAECDGSATIAPGVTVGQQARSTFGFCYREEIGNDVTEQAGYMLHLIYGSKAAPSEHASGTINESPEPATMSWECSTTPVNITAKVNGKSLKPTSILSINAIKTAKEKMEALEAILYGSGETAARLPLPDEVITLVGATTPSIG